MLLIRGVTYLLQNVNRHGYLVALMNRGRMDCVIKVITSMEVEVQGDGCMWAMCPLKGKSGLLWAFVCCEDRSNVWAIVCYGEREAIWAIVSCGGSVGGYCALGDAMCGPLCAMEKGW